MKVVEKSYGAGGEEGNEAGGTFVRVWCTTQAEEKKACTRDHLGNRKENGPLPEKKSHDRNTSQQSVCNVRVSNAVLTTETDKTGGVQELLGDGGLDKNWLPITEREKKDQTRWKRKKDKGLIFQFVEQTEQQYY